MSCEHPSVVSESWYDPCGKSGTDYECGLCNKIMSEKEFNNVFRNRKTKTEKFFGGYRYTWIKPEEKELATGPKLQEVPKVSEDFFSDMDAALKSKSQEGIKHDQDKPPVGLISTIALIEEAKVMLHGKKKYDSHNWRGGISFQRLVDALLRHALAYNNGQMYDEESGLSHMAHVRACAAFLLEQEVTHPELNDLWKGSPE